MRKVAIIGTVGVPANYGGFETLVENIIGEYCPNERTAKGNRKTST